VNASHPTRCPGRHACLRRLRRRPPPMGASVGRVAGRTRRGSAGRYAASHRPQRAGGGRDLGVRAPAPARRRHPAARAGQDRPAARSRGAAGRPAVFGIFLAQRKQLLGIKARAERAWHAHVERPVESHVA